MIYSSNKFIKLIWAGIYIFQRIARLFIKVLYWRWNLGFNCATFACIFCPRCHAFSKFKSRCEKKSRYSRKGNNYSMVLRKGGQSAFLNGILKLQTRISIREVGWAVIFRLDTTLDYYILLKIIQLTVLSEVNTRIFFKKWQTGLLFFSYFQIFIRTKGQTVEFIEKISILEDEKHRKTC